MQQSLRSMQQLVPPYCRTQRPVLFLSEKGCKTQPNSRDNRRIKANCQPASGPDTNVNGQQACSTQKRKIGCSELYNMTEMINAQTLSAAEKPPSSTDAAKDTQEPAHHSQESTQIQQQGPAGSSRDADYYAGLLMTDVRVDNQASGADMLKRSLQLAGIVAAVLALLTYLFLASNQLI